MIKIALVVERSEEGVLWGRVNYEDNLIFDSGSTENELESKLKQLLKDFHDLDPAKIKFEVLYDLEALFAAKEYLNVSEIARRAGISVALMQQYKAGLKYPSAERVKLIENVIRELGNELSKVKISPDRQAADSKERKSKTVKRTGRVKKAKQKLK